MDRYSSNAVTPTGADLLPAQWDLQSCGATTHNGMLMATPTPHQEAITELSVVGSAQGARVDVTRAEQYFVNPLGEKGSGAKGHIPCRRTG